MIAAGGGAIMDLCKLLGCKRPDTVHNLYFKRFPVRHEKDVIAIPTACGTGSECTNISVAIVKDEKDGKLTGGEIMRFKNLVAGILGWSPRTPSPR